MEKMQQYKTYTKFDAGDKVILHSLIEATHLNGRRAIVHEYPKVDDSSDGELCCKVHILPEETTAPTATSSLDKREMETKNMALDYPSGQEVKLHGLVGAKHLNGSVATIISYRVVKKNGKREPRYVVEVPIHADDYKKDDGDDTVANVKQILVSPKNIIHLPGQKPSVSVLLNQRLIFTGSMKSIIKVLNQDVPLRKPNVGFGAFMKSEYNLLTAEDKLTSEASAMVGMAAVGRNIRGIPPEIEQRGCEILSMGKLWKKIKLRSYRAEDTTAKGDDTEEEGNNHLPPSYQSLQSICPSMGRMHKICFNPKCYKVIQNPTSKQSKMKRCRKCNAVAYCNRECAIEAWDHHRKVCKVIQNDNVKFADYVTLNSPQRMEVMETQRMVRLCVNRIASLDNSDGHFQNKQSSSDDESGNSTNNSTAKLVYDVMTQLGPDITNKILMMIENPPPQNREVTVAVAFNSLGADLVYSNEDIQLFANVHDCSVTYQQQQVAEKDDEGEGAGVVEDEKKGTAYTDIVALEPNGELPGGGSIRGNVGSVIGDMGTDGYNSFLNSMNNALPGGIGRFQ